MPQNLSVSLTKGILFCFLYTTAYLTKKSGQYSLKCFREISGCYKGVLKMIKQEELLARQLQLQTEADTIFEEMHLKQC